MSDNESGVSFQSPFKIKGRVKIDKKSKGTWKAAIKLVNEDTRKQKIENLVPFGENPAHSSIT